MASKSFEYYLNILGVTLHSTRDEIKKAYWGLMNQWHPDKFPNDEQKHIEANEKSKLINDAYDNIKKDYKYFLKTENTVTIRVESSNIHSVGYDTQKFILQIQFLNGGVYEYYNVPMSVFIDLMNAKSKGKFARRFIYYSFRYKKFE